jgi:hypothetical protein
MIESAAIAGDSSSSCQQIAQCIVTEEISCSVGSLHNPGLYTSRFDRLFPVCGRQSSTMQNRTPQASTHSLQLVSHVHSL